ncbi:hypothetical protein [Halomonas sp. LBP4]|nr:hypothetical protein [Halomonas sp. LBP4]
MSTDPKEQRRTRHPLPAVDCLTPGEIASLREEMLQEPSKRKH